MTARILEYHPEDMTVTAEAGLLLSDLQKTLNQSGQWLHQPSRRLRRAS